MRDLSMRPRASVIVTHFNYSRFIADALISVIEQSIEDWQLIVVDDQSSEAEFKHLKQIVSDLDDPRIVLIQNEENLGQIGAMFHGVSIATGDFIAMLDPDDIYCPAFLETMLAGLLNPIRNAGMAACEMGVYSKSLGVLSRHSTSFRMQAVKSGRQDEFATNLLVNGYSNYFSAWRTGWVWAATSGMMFRKSLLDAIVPHRPIPFTRFEGDSYCAIGCHMIAGTVFIDQMLSWRGVHDSNAAKNQVVIFDDQRHTKMEFIDTLWQVKLLVAEVILANRELTGHSGSNLVSNVLAHIGREGAMMVAERNAAAKEVMFRYSLGGL